MADEKLKVECSRFTRLVRHHLGQNEPDNHVPNAMRQNFADILNPCRIMSSNMIRGGQA